MEDRGALWHKVISSKKWEEGGEWSLQVDGSYGGGVWRAIRSDQD